jgi:cytochrome c oxidase subunit 1
MNHRLLGKLFLFTSLAFLAIGGLLAMAMRWQLAWPGTAIPFLGSSMPRLREQGGVIPPEIYAEFFTQHGTIMIFYVIIPVLVGGFGGYLIPLQVGARAMAFPRVNALSYLLHVVGGAVLLISFLVPKGAGASGWTAYTPLSRIGTQGQNWWIVSVLFFSAAQILMAVCQATTIINARAPGMSMNRLPIFCWNMLATAAVTLLSTPALMAALVLLLLERMGVANYFSPAPWAGSTASNGVPLLWQHMFWFNAHPAVYIMILPAMGIVSEILPDFSRKPLFGYNAFVLTTWAIAVLGFLVWGHHMFQSGMNPYLGTTFMAATMVIAVPSAVKTFNWIATLWRGCITMGTAMLHAIGFVSMFVIGGLSGIFAASTPVDVYIHDTYFIVGHLHYVLFGGSLFAIFGGLVYWWPRMFGRVLDERLGRLHFWLTFVAYNGTFFPMFVLGAGGMMRRMYDTTQYAYLRPLQPINVFISLSAFALGAAQLLLLANLAMSAFSVTTAAQRLFRAMLAACCTAPLAVPIGYWCNFAHPLTALLAAIAALSAAWYAGRSTHPGYSVADISNPWQANTLEWQISSGATRTSNAELPTVYHPPYEYSLPGMPDGIDFLPQSHPSSGSARL